MNILDTTALDFPHIVIEFFRRDLTQRPSDMALRILSPVEHGRLHAAYDSTNKQFTMSSIIISNEDNRVYSHRWGYIESIVVIQQSALQSYFCKSLDHPHYSVHPLEYNSFLNHLQRHQKKNKGEPKLLFCNNKNNHCVENRLWVTNIQEPNHTKLLMDFPLEKMLELVTKSGVYDKKRYNYKIDAGLTASHCQTRKNKWYGLAGPNKLVTNQLLLVKNIKQKIYSVFYDSVPHQLRSSVYKDVHQAKLFSCDEDNPREDGLHIHSFRISIGEKYSELAIHRDDNNDNKNPIFSPVLVLSWLVVINQNTTRIAIITYSRKSVSNSMKKIHRYSSALSDLSLFYKEMKIQGRAEITPDIFNQEYKREGNEQLLAARIAPHMDTCIHWSAMGADALLKINRKYHVAFDQALALLFSVCACNSPDFFRIITDAILTDEELGNKYFKKPASHIAIEVYEMIFGFKAEASRNKHAILGQRHQPCGNTQASREAIQQSLLNLVDIYHSLSCFDQKKSLGCKLHVHSVYLSITKRICSSEKVGGVFGAGPLIANKIIQMGALVGLFPFQFLLQSKIAESTTTFKYLKERYTLDNPSVDCPILLEALASFTATNLRVAEGICCKAGQKWHADTGGRKVKATDTIFHDMSILTHRLHRTNNLATLSIVEVTPGGIINLPKEDLCWKENEVVRLTPWAEQAGYWSGDLNRASTGESIGGRCLKSHVRMVRPVVPSIGDWGKKETCASNQNETLKRKRTPPQKKSSKTTESEVIIWRRFNYPSQSDVIIASLDCRAPFNKWTLLSEALKKRKIMW
jgi:hypothetical protein